MGKTRRWDAYRGFSLGFSLREHERSVHSGSGCGWEHSRGTGSLGSVQNSTLKSEFQYVCGVYQIQDINLKVF